MRLAFTEPSSELSSAVRRTCRSPIWCGSLMGSVSVPAISSTGHFRSRARGACDSSALRARSGRAPLKPVDSCPADHGRQLSDVRQARAGQWRASESGSWGAPSLVIGVRVIGVRVIGVRVTCFRAALGVGANFRFLS